MSSHTWSAVVLAMVVGCGGSTDSSPDSGVPTSHGGDGGDASADGSTDGGTPSDAAPDASDPNVPPTAPGAVIFTSASTKVVATNNGGGFTPQPPPGSSCAYGAASYTFDVATSALSWTLCEAPDAGSPLADVTGMRTLSTGETTELVAALGMVKVSSMNTGCGADKSVETIAITTAAGSRTYEDEFYQCQGGDKIFVANIDAAFSEFAKLAK